MGAEEGGFEMGVRIALEAILTSPHFLFRMEKEPDNVEPGEVYELDEVDLASRISFFLWGTNPDEELLRLARSGDLSKSKNLERQARRLLLDPARKLWLRGSPHYGCNSRTWKRFARMRSGFPTIANSCLQQCTGRLNSFLIIWFERIGACSRCIALTTPSLMSA